MSDQIRHEPLKPARASTEYRGQHVEGHPGPEFCGRLSTDESTAAARHRAGGVVTTAAACPGVSLPCGLARTRDAETDGGYRLHQSQGCRLHRRMLLAFMSPARQHACIQRILVAEQAGNEPGQGSRDQRPSGGARLDGRPRVGTRRGNSRRHAGHRCGPCCDISHFMTISSGAPVGDVLFPYLQSHPCRADRRQSRPGRRSR